MGPRWRRCLGALRVDQRDRWALWIPVLFGAGIAAYFALTIEVWRGSGSVAAGVFLAAVALTWRFSAWRMALFGCALVAAGFAAAQWRAHSVAAPVLGRDFGPGLVAGRVVAVDRRPQGMRVLLDRLELQGLTADATPARVRVRLRRGDSAEVGDFIQLRARLSPPAAPAMPGAYDFQRHAWFARIGGVGFAYTKATPMPGPAARRSSDGALWLSRSRLAIADRIRAALPGTAGAVAAALIVGDRSAISEETLTAMRESGLAHLLAISGLHIGLVATILFSACGCCWR